MVTYVTGCYRLTPKCIECNHLFDAAWIVFQDRICLQNSLGGGGWQTILSHSFYSIYLVETLHCAVSHLVIHYWFMSHLWNAKVLIKLKKSIFAIKLSLGNVTFCTRSMKLYGRLCTNDERANQQSTCYQRRFERACACA